jgi:putative DNA primase/helicase
VAISDPGSATIVDQAIARIELLAGDERDAAVRALPAELVNANVSDVEQQRARATVTTKTAFSGVGLTEFAELLRAAKRERKELAEYQAKMAAHVNARAAIDAKRSEGVLLPPPHAPIDVARELAAQLPRPARWWRGDFYMWTGTRYALWRDEAVDNWLYSRTADAFFEGGEDKGPAPWRPTENKITGVSHALSRGVLYRPSELEVDDSPEQVACANGVYDVPTGTLLAHSAERFNLQSVPFDYDAAADAPTWRGFLDDVLPKDAQLFLQEWFGYVLSGRTDLEKIANLVGPPRSGKGTTGTVLEALLGGENVASPSMPSLVGTFGEQPLIGKTLAIFSDISWSHRDIVTGVEILKAISGQDTRDVNRKNREIWHGRLGVRFMIMGNDMPKFTDASGALAGRMIHVQFPRSVAGREDPTLKPRLLLELPGILNWALEGLRRLGDNGRFTVPQTSAELAAEVRRQQSPVQGFLDDCCLYSDAANPVPLDELHPVYRAWARQSDVEHPLDRERFSRALSSAGLMVRRERIGGVRARRVYGIAPSSLTAWTELVNPLGTVPPVN